MVEVPVERYFGPAEKVNITLPRILLSRIDDYAKAHGATRSGFLAQAARQAMRHKKTAVKRFVVLKNPLGAG